MSFIRLFALLSVFVVGLGMGQMSYANNNGGGLQWFGELAQQTANLVNGITSNNDLSTSQTQQYGLRVKRDYKLRQHAGLNNPGLSNTSRHPGRLKFTGARFSVMEPSGRKSYWYPVQDVQTGQTFVLNSGGVPSNTKRTIETLARTNSQALSPANSAGYPQPQNVELSTRTKTIDGLICNDRLDDDGRISMAYRNFNFRYNQGYKIVGYNKYKCARLSVGKDDGIATYRFFVNKNSSCYRNYARRARIRGRRLQPSLNIRHDYGQFCLNQQTNDIYFRAEIPRRLRKNGQRWARFHLGKAPSRARTRTYHHSQEDPWQAFSPTVAQ